MLLKSKLKEEIKRYLETNENEDTMTQKSMGHSQNNFQREILAIHVYLKKKERYQIIN